MNKIIIPIITLSLLIMSCGDMGKKAETKAAEEVKIVKSESTVTYSNVEAGSNLDWRAAHLGGVQPRFGKVSLKEGSVQVNDGKVSNASIVVDLTSLTVENFEEGSEQKAQLTGHLLTGDFFDTQQYPTAQFDLTSMEAGANEFNSKVTGNLTIKDVTKSITFNANVNVSDDRVSIQSEDFSIDRTDWGLTYNVEGTAGVPVNYLIANDVGFTINVNLTK